MSGDRSTTLERAGGVPVSGELELRGGVRVPLLAPNAEAGFVELLHLARRDGLQVLPLGNASWIANERAPRSADFALSTRAYAGVVAYEPGDGTLTARAGSTLTELDVSVRSGGHVITPDVAQPDRATLGGVVASGRSGFDRLRRGPTRHHVLGTRTLLADGSPTASGGQLVKNVTGYDLHRLYCGSRGTLGLVLEASLRLFPRAEQERVLLLGRPTLDASLRAAEELLALPYEPFAVRIVETDDTLQLEAYFAGRTRVLDAISERLTTVVRDARWIDGEGARAMREAARDEQALPTLVVTPRASQLIASLQAIDALCRTAACVPRREIHPGLAEVRVRFPGADPDALERLVAHSESDEWRAMLSAPAPRWLYTDQEQRPASPVGLELMQRLRDALDPNAVFARGRFSDVL